MGRVGKQVARRLTGFDTRTIYYDVADIPPEGRQNLNAEPVSFDQLLQESDYVTLHLHLPLTRRTRGIMSDREFARMKSAAYLINASRGPVVDESARYRALAAGVSPGPVWTFWRRSQPRGLSAL